MRQIKFRAWDKRKKILYQDITIYDFARIKEHFKKVDEFVKRFELVQFIGLLDKNGKEIYEGDIVKKGKIKYTIVFDKGEFRLMRGHVILLSRIWQERYCLEVIGNIYENPELLEAKK